MKFLTMGLSEEVYNFLLEQKEKTRVSMAVQIELMIRDKMRLSGVDTN